MNSSQVLLVTLLLFVLVTPSAYACDCRNGNLTERIESSQFVFVAVVTEFKPLDHVTLRVKEIFKGRPGASIKIPTAVSDCDYFLPPIAPRPGEAFLLFVGQVDQQLYVSRCQNSGLASERRDDLTELRRRNRLDAKPDNPTHSTR